MGRRTAKNAGTAIVEDEGDFQLPTDLKPVLDKDSLYIGEGGRLFCGAIRCAGSSAYYTGLDLRGKRVRRITKEQLATFPEGCGLPTCGGCGRTFQK